MEISQKLLALLFAFALLSGAGLGLLWNLIHLLRALCGVRISTSVPSSSHKGERSSLLMRIWHWVRLPGLFLLDLLFGLTCVCVLILLLYYTNDGQFRFFAPIGMGCGFLLWYQTLGRLMFRLTDATVRTLYRMLCWMGRMLKRVLQGILSVMYRLWMVCFGRRWAAWQACRQRRKACRRADEWFALQTGMATQGFGLQAEVTATEESLSS